MIDRYRISTEDMPTYQYKQSNGDWCKWEDVEKLEKRIEELERQNSLYKECLQSIIKLPDGFKIEDIRLKDE